MTMFKLNEEKLRAAFARREEAEDAASLGWVAPFDPMSIDADELHRIVDDCLLQEIIQRADPRAMIAVYPQAISDPEPLLSVNPCSGPMLLGGEAIHHVSDEEASTPEDRSITALRSLVDDANALCGESGAAEMRSKDGGSEARHTAETDDRSPCD